MHKLTTSQLGRRFLLGAAITSLLVACGVDQVAGIQGSGSPVAAGYTSVGPITGFGSVIVDGVEYSTTGAQIRIDDEPAPESQLRVGQIVSINGSVNADGTTSVATTISFTSDLRGPVTQIDLANSTFTVLGQSVQVTDATLFDESIQPGELAGLAAGALVQVSGFANAAGDLVASRVDVAAAGATLQVKGAVQALDATASTFRINTLTVSYGGVMPTGTLANGGIVLVRGTALSNGGALVATRVQVLSGLGAAANDRGQLEGIITSFTSNADFALNGQRVATDSSTELVLRGATLGLDVPVKVRGTFNASGVLVATRVEVKPNSLSVVRGLVTDVSAATRTLNVLGIPVTTGSSTSFEDRSDLHILQFRLEDVRTGDYVEVRGTPAPAGGGLEATFVEREKPANLSYLQGVATNVANPSFAILGTLVTTNARTLFAGPGGQEKAAAEFFNEAPGKTLKVRGALSGSIIADRVQIVR